MFASKQAIYVDLDKAYSEFTYSIIVEAIFHGTVIVLKLIIKIDKS
jgi:hypothetical protein